MKHTCPDCKQECDCLSGADYVEDCVHFMEPECERVASEADTVEIVVEESWRSA